MLSVMDNRRWLSVSSTTEYELCARRYRFAYRDRVPPLRLAPAGWRVGTAVHAALEAAYRHRQATGGAGPLTDAAAAAHAALRGSWTDAQLDPGALARAEALVDRTLARLWVRARDIVGVEHPLRLVRPDGVRIAGLADLILRRGRDRLEIWDHKVTRYPRSPAELRADLQLNLYGWLARRQWPWARRVIAGHHYPPLGRRVSVVLAAGEMQAAAARVLAVGAAAAADAVFAAAPGEHCRHCCWSGLCPEGRVWLAGGYRMSRPLVTSRQAASALRPPRS